MHLPQRSATPRPTNPRSCAVLVVEHGQERLRQLVLLQALERQRRLLDVRVRLMREHLRLEPRARQLLVHVHCPRPSAPEADKKGARGGRTEVAEPAPEAAPADLGPERGEDDPEEARDGDAAEERPLQERPAEHARVEHEPPAHDEHERRALERPQQPRGLARERGAPEEQPRD